MRPATLITGVSRGIGRQLARDIAADGRPVIGTLRAIPAPADRDPDLNGVALLALDVRDPDAQRDMSRALDGRPIDLLICNAGVYPDKGATLDTGYGAPLWHDGFATNVTGVFLTIQTLLPNLRAAPGAKIAILSSMMGSQTRAPGGSYIYRASKAAALNLGRNLARDLKPDGISVGIYHPGWVRTDMGGPQADISVDAASGGLRARFDALGPATTGCFETWDGQALDY